MSLALEVERLNADPAGRQSTGMFTEAHMMQAVNETFEKNAEFFEAQMAERTVQLENQHRVKLRECEDLLEQWTEASQMWRDKSEGQTIDIRWWEAFGDAFPDQLMEFDRSSAEIRAGGCESTNGPGGEEEQNKVGANSRNEAPRSTEEKTPGLSTLGDTISRMHRACVKQHEPAVRQAFLLDSAVSRLTTNGIMGGTKIPFFRRRGH